jgi:cardiolipin hydrolase
MPHETLRHALQQTLADFRLSRGEKSALGSMLQDPTLTSTDLARVRNTAFELAREALADGPPATILNWLEDVLKTTQPQAGATVTSEVHFSPGTDCPQRIAALYANARQTADACVFTITDDRVSGAILAAHARGVRVRIVTDNEKAFDPGSDVERFKQAGIDVRVDCTPYHMHHKFAVFDGRLLLNGSYNWTRGAADNNLENFIITSDRRLIDPFAELFEKLWCQFLYSPRGSG